MSARDLEKLAKLARKYGISHMKLKDIELKFDHPTIPDRVYDPKEDKFKASEEPTEEEIAFWSSGANLPES